MYVFGNFLSTDRDVFFPTTLGFHQILIIFDHNLRYMWCSMLETLNVRGLLHKNNHLNDMFHNKFDNLKS